MNKRKRPGFLAEYAKHAGISRQALRKHLERAGIDYMKPFNWEQVDRLLDANRHLGRDHLRRRSVRNPDV